jgi:hypothetical protein
MVCICNICWDNGECSTAAYLVGGVFLINTPSHGSSDTKPCHCLAGPGRSLVGFYCWIWWGGSSRWRQWCTVRSRGPWKRNHSWRFFSGFRYPISLPMGVRLQKHVFPVSGTGSIKGDLLLINKGCYTRVLMVCVYLSLPVRISK